MSHRYHSIGDLALQHTKIHRAVRQGTVLTVVFRVENRVSTEQLLQQGRKTPRAGISGSKAPVLGGVFWWRIAISASGCTGRASGCLSKQADIVLEAYCA